MHLAALNALVCLGAISALVCLGAQSTLGLQRFQLSIYTCEYICLCALSALSARVCLGAIRVLVSWCAVMTVIASGF